MNIAAKIASLKTADSESLKRQYATPTQPPVGRILFASELLNRSEPLPAVSPGFENQFGRLRKSELTALENEMPGLAPAVCRALALEIKHRHMEGAAWFWLEKDKDRQGPMDFLALEKKVRQAETGAQVHVWRNGWPDWVPLGKCSFLTAPYFFKTEPMADAIKAETLPPKPHKNKVAEKFPFMLSFMEFLLVPVWFVLIFVAPWGEKATLGRAVSFIMPLTMAGFSLMTAIGFLFYGTWTVRFKLGTSVLALIYLLVAIFSDDRGFMFKLALGLHLITLFIIFNFIKNNTTS